MIGLLAQFFRASDFFKIVLRYFSKVYRKSNVCKIRFDCLRTLYLFTWLPCNTIFLIVKNGCVREELIDLPFFSSDATSTDQFARTYFWWVRTLATLTFGPCTSPTDTFPLHLPLSVCVHSYQRVPQLHPHLHGRHFPTPSTPDRHLV